MATNTTTVQCTHRHAVCVKSEGGIESGEFTEEYECDCGARGRITGNAEQAPSEWTRTGEVFN